MESSSSFKPVTIKKRFDETQLLKTFRLNINDDFVSLPNCRQVSLLKPKAERVISITPPVRRLRRVIQNPPPVVNTVKKISLPQFDLKSKVPYAQFVKNVTSAPDTKVTPAVQTPAMNNSRMNLFKALAKAKNQTVKSDETPSTSPSPTSEETPTTSPSPPPTVSKSKSVSPVDDKSLIKKIESPPSVSASDDSFEMKTSPDDQKNDEIAKIRFLKQFFLYTHSYSKYLNSRRSERKRRSCTSTEKTDFHYGNWELWEQKNAKRKKLYLLSPPAKRRVNQKSNETDESKVVKKSSRQSSTSSSSLCSLGDDYFKLCVVCYSSGENILTCSDCPAFFHRRCHKLLVSEFVNLLGTHCPNCIREKHKVQMSLMHIEW